MAIVTISRQFGAGGSSVARIVAEFLGAELVDSSLVAEVARRLEFSEREVEKRDEHPETFADRLLDSLRYLAPAAGSSSDPPYRDGPVDRSRAIANMTEELLREVARLGNAVIVGRGGAFVLHDRPHTLHVFLRAPDEVRVQTIMARFTVEEQIARTRMRETDASRDAYIRQLYKADWRDSTNYDLVINTGRVGFGRAADLILAAIGRRSFADPELPPDSVRPTVAR